MKILWLSHLIPYPPKGGVLMRSYHLLQELSKYHEVHLLAFNQRSLLNAYFKSGEGEREAKDHFMGFLAACVFFDISSENAALGRGRLATKSLLTPDPYTINWLKSREFRSYLQQYVSEHSFDIVHFDTISLAPYRSEIPHSVPCVMDHHNVESHMLLRRAGIERSFLKKAYFWQEGRRLLKYERKNLKLFDLHITCSQDDRLRLMEIAPGINSMVVPNGIAMADTEPPRSGSPAKKLLFVGGLSWYPNADAMHFFLREVWPILMRVDPEINIDIVGRSPSKVILDAASADSRIRVHGFVDNILRFYSNAAIYICPIKDGGGTKLKVLDALAHRVPLVAHPIACEGIEIVAGRHALLAEQPMEMADRIVELLMNPERARALGDAGYQLIKSKYDFSTIGRSFSNALDELKASHNGTA